LALTLCLKKSKASLWGYDVRNQLVADVFCDNGKEFIKFTNGKEITVETAWRWEWESWNMPEVESDIARLALKLGGSKRQPQVQHRLLVVASPLTSWSDHPN
jgi:hypothetical protein